MSSQPTAMPPEVDLTVGVRKPLPPELLATLNPLQRIMRSLLGAITFTLISFTIGSIPVIGIPPVLYFLQWLGLAPHWPFRRFFDLCTANWMSFMTMVYENLFGIKIRTFGYGGKFKRRSLIIMNHVSHLDWLYLWSVIDRQGDLSFWKVITKCLPIRSLPILGQCMQMSCFLFVKRDWKQDKIEFRDKLYYFNAINYPVQLLLFPEGGDFTPKAKIRSDQFAKENNLPILNYCFHPRTTGFKYAINALRDGGLDAVYDMTVAYPDVLPKTELDVGKGIMPKEVHFHIKKYDNEEIPEEQKELEKWLRDRWTEKEERLKNFYTHHEFRETSHASESNGQTSSQNEYIRKFHVSNGDHGSDGHVVNRNGHPGNDSMTNGYSSSHTQKSPEVLRPRNRLFFLYSVFIFISTNLMLLIPMWFFPYFFIYMFLGCVFLYFGHHKGMGHLYMTFKRKEIEKAIKECCKYNN